MTIVTGTFTVPSLNGNVGASGYLIWVPTGRYTGGGSTIIPEPFTAPLDATGTMAQVNVDPTGPTWCWKVTEQLAGIIPANVRYVQVPSTGPVAYKDLVDVDPNTLAPNPVPVGVVDAGTASTPVRFIQMRRDTAANWTTANPILALGEEGLETDTGNVKIGDGSTHWASLAYAFDGPIFGVRDYGAKGDGSTDDTAAITRAINAAKVNGGRVSFQSGTYKLTAPLPVYSGVWYEGVEPIPVPQVVTNGTYMGDAEWNYTGGAVLVGDGTFACFEANSTDAASPDANVGNTQISNVRITGFGLDGFTYGLHVGAANVMGIVWGKIDKLWIKNCSQWAVYMVNWQHLDVGDVRSCLCQNGQYWGANMPKTTLMPGNSTIRELFNLIPRDGRDNRLCRGIVFEATNTNGRLNEVHAERIQANGFNRSLLSVTATFTSGSTSVGVPDGTKFAVGMPVILTTTNYGYTANYTYIVTSVSGNTLTLASSRTSANISASGTGSLMLNTYGYANIEISSLASGAGVTNSSFSQVDSEGTASVGVYWENGIGVDVKMGDLPGTVLTHLVARNLTYSRIVSTQAASTDFDGNTASTTSFMGARGTTVQRPCTGLWRDNALSINALAIAGGSAGEIGGDFHTRVNNFIYPTHGLGDRIYPRDFALTLSGAQAGDVIFAGSSATTFTLPTIVTDTSTPGTSHIGLVFEIYNVGSATLTVATDGTQTMNKIAGRTSTTVAAGAGLKIVGAKDNSGNLFWLARPLALTT